MLRAAVVVLLCGPVLAGCAKKPDASAPVSATPSEPNEPSEPSEPASVPQDPGPCDGIEEQLGCSDAAALRNENRELMGACTEHRDCSLIEGPCGGVTSVNVRHQACFVKLEGWDMACVDCMPSEPAPSLARCREGQCVAVPRR